MRKNEHEENIENNKAVSEQTEILNLEYIHSKPLIQDGNIIITYPPREMSKERKVIVSGYIPLQERIKNFIKSGQALEEGRKLAYAYADDDQVVNNKIKSLEEALRDYDTEIDEINYIAEETRRNIIEIQQKEAQFQAKKRARAEKIEKLLAQEEQKKSENQTSPETPS